jgi:hypothetical protein
MQRVQGYDVAEVERGSSTVLEANLKEARFHMANPGTCAANAEVVPVGPFASQNMQQGNTCAILLLWEAFSPANDAYQ